MSQAEPVRVELTVHTIFFQIDTIRAAHDRWVRDEDSAKAPPASIFDESEKLIVLVKDRLPKFLAGSDIEQAALAYDDAMRRHDELDIAVPRGWFWDSLSKVFDAKGRFIENMNKPYHVESIAKLDRMEVLDTQICKLYEWVDEEGRPQIDKLEKERREPGSVIGNDYIHPREKKRRQLIAEYKKTFQEWQDGGGVAPQITKKDDKKEAPESWEDLADLDVNPEQAAKIKKVTVAEAAENLREARKLKKGDAVDEYETMTIQELRALCKERGISSAPSMNKESLVKAIRYHASKDLQIEPEAVATA